MFGISRLIGAAVGSQTPEESSRFLLPAGQDVSSSAEERRNWMSSSSLPLPSSARKEEGANMLTRSPPTGVRNE